MERKGRKRKINKKLKQELSLSLLGIRTRKHHNKKGTRGIKTGFWLNRLKKLTKEISY